MAKPGVMLYFDIRRCLKRLTPKEKGELFEAILNYGEFGVEPEMKGCVGVAWDFIVPRLEQDNREYESKIQQNRYAVYVREQKKLKLPVLSMEEWLETEEEVCENPETSEDDREVSEDHREGSDDAVRYPNTNTTSTATANTTTDPKANTNLVGVTQEKPAQKDKGMVPERPALPGHTPPDFVPPGVDEVRRFCQQRKINVDAQRFVNYYASIGWQVGQLPMRDWKAALLNWHAKDEKLEKEKKNGNTAAQTDLSLARRIGAVL